jgi:hypothetical protein
MTQNKWKRRGKKKLVKLDAAESGGTFTDETRRRYQLIECLGPWESDLFPAEQSNGIGR